MALTNPLWLGPVQGQEYGPPASARVHRGILDVLFTEGVLDVPGGDLRVTAGTGMNVTVASGRGIVDGDDVAFQGAFLCQNEGAQTVPVPPAPVSSSRIDVLVLRVYDGQSTGGARNENVFEVLSGNPASPPTAPAIPNSATELARWTVPAGTTSMSNLTITDRRVQSGAASIKIGTQSEPLTTAQIAAVSTPRIGQLVFNTDINRLQVWNGSAWFNVGSGASGKYTFGPTSLPLQTWVPLSIFVGAGFSEVDFTIWDTITIPIGYNGIRVLATADAAQAQFVTTFFSGSSQPRVTGAADSASTVAWSVSASDYLMRNVRYTADGYLRFEAYASQQTSSTSTWRMNWRAR